MGSPSVASSPLPRLFTTTMAEVSVMELSPVAAGTSSRGTDSVSITLNAGRETSQMIPARNAQA